MATSSVSSVLSLLTQPGSALASVAATLPANVLQDASAEDLVTISNAAAQLQQVETLFGSPASTQPDSLFSAQPGDLLTSLEQTFQESLANGTASPGAQTTDASADSSGATPDVNTLLQQAENPLTLDLSGATPSPGIQLYG